MPFGTANTQSANLFAMILVYTCIKREVSCQVLRNSNVLLEYYSGNSSSVLSELFEYIRTIRPNGGGGGQHLCESMENVWKSDGGR